MFVYSEIFWVKVKSQIVATGYCQISTFLIPRCLIFQGRCGSLWWSSSVSWSSSLLVFLSTRMSRSDLCVTPSSPAVPTCAMIYFLPSLSFVSGWCSSSLCLFLASSLLFMWSMRSQMASLWTWTPQVTSKPCRCSRSTRSHSARPLKTRWWLSEGGCGASQELTSSIWCSEPCWRQGLGQLTTIFLVSTSPGGSCASIHHALPRWTATSLGPLRRPWCSTSCLVWLLCLFS